MKLNNKTILVTDGEDFLGKTLVKQLKQKGVKKIISLPAKKYDWRNFQTCKKVLKDVDIVIHNAGNTGGLGYNQKFPGTLFYDNLLIGTQLLEAARTTGVLKFVALGTISSYPKLSPVPFKEENLWNGFPDETSAAYGMAKKMLLVQSQAYRQQFGFSSIFLMPANPYGPGDDSDPKSSHVIPALIRKYFEATKNHDKSVSVWGTGKATREFIYIEDAARAVILATAKYDKPEPVNLGAGFEISIKDLAGQIAKLVGYKGVTIWDSSKPEGQLRRSLDNSRAFKEFGFKATTGFSDGLKKTIEWYLKSL